MTRAFVAVGSNIEPERNVRRALSLLCREVTVVGISTVYLTEAIDRPDSPRYYNCVVEIEAGMGPSALKSEVLRRIEDSCGRKRSGDRYADRTMDLDLILYDDLAVRTVDQVLPDPDIAVRPFLAFSLFELDPDLTVAGLGPVSRIKNRFAGVELWALPEYTERLRKETCHGNPKRPKEA